MSEEQEKRFYEISGEGFGSVRDLCDSLRLDLSQGVELTDSVQSVSVGVPATSNRAIGTVYIRNAQQQNQVKLDIVLYRKTLEEGKDFLDYKFQTAFVRPEYGVNVESLERALEKVLGEQKANRRPRKKLATASSAPNPDF